MRRAWLLGALAAACTGGRDASRPVRPSANLGLGVELVVFDADPEKPRGLAVVQDRRKLELPAGIGEVRIEGVPALVVESSVSLRSFTDPEGLRVRSQRFERGASGVAVALDGAVGKEVVVDLSLGEETKTLTGRLVSFDASGITVDEGNGRLRLVPFSEGLLGIRLASAVGVGAPALTWEVESRGGAQLVEVVYETEGVQWVAYHDVVVDGGRVDLATRAGIWNRSGRTYDGVSLKLVERDAAAPPGDPIADLRAAQAYTDGAYGGETYGTLALNPYGEYGGETYGYGYGGAYAGQGARGKKAAAPDWFIYTLPGATTVGVGETHVALATLSDAAGAIVHRFEDVPKTLIHNGDQPQLQPAFGTPGGYGYVVGLKALPRELVIEREGGPDLPGGIVRVHHRSDAGIDLQAVGRTERSLAGQQVVVPLGLSGDLTGKRVRKTLWQDLRRKILREAFEIDVENRGKTAAKVTVVEHLYRAKKWKIRAENRSHQPAGERSIHFPVTVPAGDSVKITYEVEYTW